MSLPDGWIQQYDSNYKHSFWIDTRSTPPRAIWVHPYEDEQFLAEHPEIRAKRETSTAPDLDAPPSYDAATGGHAPESKDKSGSSKHRESHDPVSAGESSQAVHKRGVFGKLKDKTIGTKEEREEQKRIRAEEAARAEEQARRERMRQKQEREKRRRIRAEQVARAEEQARQARMRELEEREAYMRAHGGYAPYHPGYGADLRYGHGQSSGFGGDNTGALLLGGLAGGLLLGGLFGI
ncbi:hypothetical protein L210DRAFT_3642142 [Boletus edulis BED1]|uniref:WW domain-containing protein n=1 Tax=Boletus edulis BED1 TaxID=1328754 RepID=A0AAD4C1K5_BOLED|nr:hypothetical protein L210DRAFT_3642142 [Boletus edulis BED1]